MRIFAKIKPSQNGENNFSFTYVGKSCQNRDFFLLGKYSQNRDFFTWQIYLLKLFAKIKFSRKFPNLQ